MDFEPYPLLDFDRGIYKAKEPWISPEKSFRKLRNLRLKNGRIVKRKGWTPFGYLSIEVTSETVGNGGLSDSGTLANFPVEPPATLFNTSDTYKIVVEDGTRTAYGYDDPQIVGQGIILHEVTDTITGGPSNYTGSLLAVNNLHSPITFADSGTGQSCEVQYEYGDYYGDNAVPQAITGDVDSGGTNLWTPPEFPPSNPLIGKGTYDFTFASPATGTVTATYCYYIGYVVYADGTYSFSYKTAWSNPVTSDYQYPSNDPIMGISNFYTLDGNEYLVSGNTNSVWLYDATAERFGNAVGSLTGTVSDFLHFCPYENVLIINNGVDPPQKYTPGSPPTIADMGTDFDADTTDNIDAARFCFRHKNRIVYLRTTEGGTDYAQRARWTPVNDIEYSAATGDEAEYYTDAPTTERIVAAKVVADELLVVFDRQSVWRLRYTEGDPFSAYQWEQIDTIEGTNSPMGNVPLSGALWIRGRDGMRIVSPGAVFTADADIPDDVLSWNTNAAIYSYGMYCSTEHEAMITFADSGETYPAHALVAHLDADKRIKGYSVYDLPFHCFGYYRQGSVPIWDEATSGYTIDEITWAPDDLIGSVGLPIVLAGDRNGVIYQYADGYADNGEDIEATLETIRLNPYQFKQCHLGYFDVIAKSSPGATAKLYLTADYDSSPHNQYTVDLTPNGTEEKVLRRVLVNRIANFHTIKLDEKSSQEFALDDITLWCKPAGDMRPMI